MSRTSNVAGAMSAGIALAWAAVAAGVVAGAVAAGADEHVPSLGALLSVPGPWIAAAVLVAWSAQRAGAAPAERPARAAAATTLFLAAAVIAYYAGKQALTGATPAPLVSLWLAVAVTLGGLGGAVTALLCARPRGTVFLGGAVSGWLLAEAFAMPGASAPESGMGLAVAALALSAGQRPGPSVRACLLGGVLGVATQAAFLMGIREALALVL